MLVNLVPEFLAAHSAPDPTTAYHDYLDRHRPVLGAYWQNYVLDPASPHAEPIIATAVAADRADLKHLLESVDVVAVAADAMRRSLEADCPVDLYLMVGVGAANAGELVVGGRGIAFVCLEHFTGRANAQTYGMGLAPELLPLWIAHEMPHVVRYPSPTSRAAIRRMVADLGGYYDGWELGSRASPRGAAGKVGGQSAAAQTVAPGFDAWEYFGYNRRQYRRLRELDAFLRRAVASDLDSTGLGLRLRYLSGGMSPAARLLAGKGLPERSGYYLGLRLVESYFLQHGAASTVRAAVDELRQGDAPASGSQTASRP